MRKFFRQFRAFAGSDAGAVTVDWVVLTGLIVGMTSLGVASIVGGAGTIGDSLVETITEDEDNPET